MPNTKYKAVSWSPSRLVDYSRCPQYFKWKGQKLCPLCFKGRTKGGFDGVPVTCSSCGGVVVAGEALERGSRIGDALDLYLAGKRGAKMPAEILNPTAQKLVKQARAEVKAGRGHFQGEFAMSRQWEPVEWFSPSAWCRAKLDYYYSDSTGTVEVTDWKTGGIDKRTGAPRIDDKYKLQMLVYSVAALVCIPEANFVTSSLVFLDTAPTEDPVVSCKEATLMRGEDLEDAKRTLEAAARPALKDTVHAPNPNSSCRWCEYSKSKGGPCKF